MHYILDGYNLIGACSHLSLKSKTKEIQLIEFIRNVSNQKNDTFSIIFDGRPCHDAYQSSQTYHHITVVVTDAHEDADSYIKRACNRIQHKDSVTVVTSDRDILLYSKKNKIQTLSSQTFLNTYLPIQSDSSQRKPKPSKYDTDYWMDQFSS